MDARRTMEMIMSEGIVAIMRADSSEQLLAAADAIRAGGLHVIEVTMTTPGALDIVREATHAYGSAVAFGVGSVLDAETARAAILAGAHFVVSPTLSPKTVEMCRRYSVPVIPGALSPTEILTAWEMGADAVKVFPASLGGPAYIKDIKAPLPQIRLVAVGGVDSSNTSDFIRAEADAVGVGSALVSSELLRTGDFSAITERARELVRSVAAGRQASV